ncbi:MAG: hypothetical protein ACXVRE_07155 [Gaiellaceae bacterium]
MGRRLLPVALVLVAAAADGAGSHELAFYALLAAVPAAAVAALEAFGGALEGSQERLHTLLWAVVLALTVAGAAARAPALAEGSVPALGRSAVAACLAIFCVQAVVGLIAELRRS